MKQWQEKYELETVDERKKYVEECIASGEYVLSPALLERMGLYMLHPYDKEIKYKEQKDIKQSQMMRAHKLSETGVKYRTTDRPLTRQEKMKKYPATKPYYDMIDTLDAKGKEVLGESGYKTIFDLRIKNPYIAERLLSIGSKSATKSIYDGLHADIEDTIQLYKTREVCINPISCGGGISSIDLDVINYSDMKIIKVIMTSFQDITKKAESDPNHPFFIIKVDIEEAIKNAELTAPQKDILGRVMQGEKLNTGSEFNLFYRACKQLANYFDKL